MKDAVRKDVPLQGALVQGSYATERANLKTWLEKGNKIKPGEMKKTTEPTEIPPILRKR